MMFNALGRVALGRGRIVGEYSLTAETGVFTLTGNAATLTYVRRLSLTAEVGAFTLSGKAAALSVSMPALKGTFTWTGNAASLRAARVLYADNLPSTTTSGPSSLMRGALGRVALGASTSHANAETTFLWRGFNIEFEKAATLVAACGQFTWTGNDTRLEFAGRPSQIRAFPRVSKPMRTQQRGGAPITAKAGSGGFSARSWGG